MEILHTSGHAYAETIEKVIRLTNPKVIIPMHTECADTFGSIPAFAPYRDRVKVLKDREAYLFLSRIWERRKADNYARIRFLSGEIWRYITD